MVKKVKNSAGVVLLSILTLGAYSHNHHETINQNLSGFFNTQLSYQQQIKYRETIRKEIYDYKFVEDNSEVKYYLGAISSYNLDSIDQKEAYKYLEYSLELLRSIKKHQWSYREQRELYNEIQQEIIPKVKDYIILGINIVEKNHPMTRDLEKLESLIKNFE